MVSKLFFRNLFFRNRNFSKIYSKILFFTTLSTLIDAWTSIGLSTTTVSATGNIMTSLETSKLLTV